MISLSSRSVLFSAASSMILLWLCHPPLAIWPLAMVALVPLIWIVSVRQPLGRRNWWIVAAVSTLYYLLSLQGLRHAHPAMYACWFALSAYLAAYHVGFLAMARRLTHRGIAIWIATPLAWMTMELLRNYLLTGISVLMLGHSLANVPAMIQIANLLGSYGVGLVIVSINAAVFAALNSSLLSVAAKSSEVQSTHVESPRIPIAVAIVLVVATLVYSRSTLTAVDDLATSQELATFALLQRNEHVEYGMSIDREVEMFQNYASEAVRSVASGNIYPDAIVWPESMFTGTVPWMIADQDLVVPSFDDGSGTVTPIMGAAEFRANIAERQRYVSDRAGYIGRMIADEAGQTEAPQFIAGSGVVVYADQPEAYSGVLHFDSRGKMQDWYGKTHLVMFGEYIPVLPWIPVLKNLVPPELGLKNGKSSKRMLVGDTVVSPNICIETAVERVVISQCKSSESGEQDVDVIVTVTNDGWFDESSVIEHHLRCAQLVAAGCRRPILSSANNGPTAWIDHRGQIVKRLPTGVNGSLYAKPQHCDAKSLYVMWGDWPVIAIGLIAIALGFKRTNATADSRTDETT
ncbi:apolipoprotein N-acyltransferase [Rubripirellula amarantea]|nr:apolipoprotein N-acyltransferase [Rubripirellula amarantea]